MNRRTLLKLVSVTGATYFVGLEKSHAWPWSRTAQPPVPSDSDAHYFTDRERDILSALADHVLPGAAAIGACRFVERLLTAFDYDPPRIFSDGANFIPLNRTQTLAWRLRLFGSTAVGGGPNDAVTGPVVGLRDQIRDVLSVADHSLGSSPAPFPDQAIAAAWSALSTPQQQLMVPIVVQSAFSNPDYGGNFEKGGWKMIFFEGESLPEGYSQYDAVHQTFIERPEAPLSTPNPGADPFPVGWLTSTFLRFKGS